MNTLFLVSAIFGLLGDSYYLWCVYGNAR